MRYMLDTCAFIDAVTEPDNLGADVCALMEDYENEFCISIETIREVILKYKNKKVWTKVWPNAEAIVESIYNEMPFIVLDINKEHLMTYAGLLTNEIEGHKDPSDHLIISHALTNKMPLISRDRKFQFYKKQGLNLIYYGN